MNERLGWREGEWDCIIKMDRVNWIQRTQDNVSGELF
jgi:hypothetical protein